MIKWTLITGASEGLGVEFARLATQDGQNVILSARSEDKLNKLAEELRGNGADVIVIPADLNDLAEVDRLWKEATADREINVLVNNAGLGRNGVFGRGDRGGWARELSVINVNILALTRLMELAVPLMKSNGAGRILNVASTSGFMPGPGMAVYHASKAFVLSLSEAVATEVKGSGVTVTAICPGATQTNFFDDADMGDVRLLKMGKPMDAAKVAEQGWIAGRGGQRVVVPGWMNKVFAFLPRISPRWLVARVAGLILART